MYQPPRDALVEDGMVRPDVSSSPMHLVDGYTPIPEGPSSSKASKIQYFQDETTNNITNFVASDAQSEKELNALRLDGQINGCQTHGDIIGEPKTEMEGFIMREDDIDVIQEPVAKTDSSIKGAHDDFKDESTLEPSNGLADDVVDKSFVFKKGRVQWSDNFGKELFQVFEYEASDTGDSDDDDDDADTHACTCSIQ